jgi:hypothetical protein
MGGDAFPFPTTPYFLDVSPGHPYFKFIQKMRELGITSRCTPTTYCPDDAVTRGQMAVFLVRSRSGDTFNSSTTSVFTDVTAAHPYFRYIQKLREWGITTGCSATQYCPDAPNTRGQMAVFIIRGFFTLW